MIIKSFEEVKRIIEKFPEASGVGYVVTPELLRIAQNLGLPGGSWDGALSCWASKSVVDQIVFESVDNDALKRASIIINWEGLPYIKLSCGTIIIGLKELIILIDKAIKHL